MRILFSTGGVSPHERVTFWCDFFARQAHLFTRGEVPDTSTFKAEATGHAAGGFALLEIRSGLESLRRTAADVARDKREAFYVRRFRRAAIWNAAPKSTQVDLAFEPGDFCISSNEWQFEEKAKGGAAFSLLVIPRGALSPLLARGRLARPFRLAADSPLGSLLSAAIDAAIAQIPLLSDELGEAVLRNLSGLVALACSDSDEGEQQGHESLRSAQLAAISRHIDFNLADPDLTPASTAAACGVSIRRLHRLFEPTGTSFTRYVLRHRLLKCRDAAAAATGTGRSVADIAFGWGFNSMATFYRAFANEFGAAPVALREASRDGSSTAASG
jgi:AraC-like DNA-binding protein